MRQEFKTYLHRQKLQLERITRDKGQARVLLCSEELGTWDGMRAQWFTCRNQLKIRFNSFGRRVLRTVRAVQLTAGGALICLGRTCNRPTEALELVWKEPARPFATPVNLYALVRHWLHEQAPGARILRHCQSSDRALSLSRFFLRVHARFAQKDCLVLAAPEPLDADRTPEMLTQALVWGEILRKRRALIAPPTIILLVPRGRSAVLHHRVRCLDESRVRVELWEYRRRGQDWELRRAPFPPEPVEHVDFHWPVLGPFRWSRVLADVLDLAPGDIRRHPRFEEYDSLRLRGLEFARAEGAARDRVTFGIGPLRTELTEHNFNQLHDLVDGILYYRRPDSPDTHHRYYRLQAERWLESLILDDVPRLFPEVAPGSVYSQIPVYLGCDTGRVDILGADLNGTLVVMELKVTEDAGLPLQALDYWGRVIRHNLSGDFVRRGYFSEVKLNRERPRIYLICPVFAFHDTTETILGSVSPQIDIWKIALNTDWRCGVRILNRTRVGRSGRV